MALSIKTEEADRLARELAQRTGETMTEAVTVALRERLAAINSAEKPDTAAYLRRLDAFLDSLGDRFDHSPVTKVEWDEACGDDIS